MDNKVLYIAMMTENNTSGVWKKILGQSRGMAANGLDVYLVYWGECSFKLARLQNDQWENIENQESLNCKGIVNNYKKRTQFLKFSLEILFSLKISVVYMRAVHILPNIIDFLRQAKAISIRVYWEIPTYPYRNEFVGIRGIRLLMADKLFFKSMQKIVDYIVVISTGNIDGILREKIILLSNGLDIHEIKKRNSYLKTNTINLLCIANYAFWHGYDRLINGLNEYYCGNKDSRMEIKINLVGSNMQELIAIIKNYGLEDKVVYHGCLYGVELDKLYSSSDIAVASLGKHRCGFSKGSELKIREYFLYGIPYITAGEDIDIPNDYKYKHAFSNDDSPISIGEIINFYHSLPSKDIASNDMHSFSIEHLSWSEKMKFVNRKPI